MPPTPSPELIALAHAHGVATEFQDWRGKHVDVPVATIVAVLSALGVDTSSPAAALTDLEDADWRRILPDYVVTREGAVTEVQVHAPLGAPVDVRLALEDGSPPRELTGVTRSVEPRAVDGKLVVAATFALPADLPLGWHELLAAADGGTSRCPVVVTPGFLGLPARVPESGAIWGFMTQLYSVRSRASWGHGDLADLAELARWSGSQLGAGFVLVNPLHSPAPVPPIEPSPYLPVTRRFVSPLYLRVEQVEEFGQLTADQRAGVAELAAPLQRPGDAETLLDRDAVWAAKRSALQLIAQLPRSAARERDYQDFLLREGDGLRDFAAWCALAEAHGPAWSEWPEELRNPESPAVETARKELADAVDFHSWLQWLADEQLALAQHTAVQAGMPLGVVHDLAVGVHPDGADTWALQNVMARGVTVGAPPDAFNQQGQDWSQPPWRPDRLAAAGYAPYRDMLRTILRHAGGIRVDHMLGLFRLWWVPEGMSAAEGTYVRYDHEALVGILALEAARAGAVVVGEDLGVFEPWVRDYLAERGVLGTSILWFERTGDGRPLPPERWRELCLAAVTTHDLPPTAGYLTGEHVRLRDRLGLLTRDSKEEARVDARERRRWLNLLID
ncbi:MAG: 4-alpha-glucanotransferase, partial [Actinomycetota bacterium]|nr:4-alpha-glucanotransferase [Actinomycetota bacterium]